MEQPADIGGLLETLRAAPPHERQTVLRSAGDVGVLIAALTTHIERLVVSDVNAALEAAAMITELAVTGCGALEQARARRVGGQALAYGGRFDEALAEYQLAIEIAGAADLAVEGARARMASMHALNSLGKFDESLRAGEAAREAFILAGDASLAARADANIGATYRVLDRPADALRHYERARPALTSEPMACAQLDSNRGVSLMDLDRFSEAEQAFLAALPVFEEFEMAWAAAVVEGNLAELATRQGRLQFALSHYDRAKRFFEMDAAQAELARVTGEQADTLALVGAIEDAQRAYEQVIPELENTGLAMEAASARAGLGRIFAQKGRIAEANRHLAQAADEFAALGQPIARARVNLHRAGLALETGDEKEAARLSDEALAALRGRPAMEAAALHATARVKLAQRDDAEAGARLDEAIQLARELELTPLLADLYPVRAELSAHRGRHDEAIDTWMAAAACVESLRGSLHAERLRSLLIGGRIDVFGATTQALLSRGAPGDEEHAFLYAERAKSRGLLDRVAVEVEMAPASPPQSDPQHQRLLTEFAALRAELNVLYSRMADAGGTKALDAARSAEVRGRQRRLTEIETQLSNTLGVTGFFAPPASATDIRGNLPADTALIEYAQIRGETLAFVVTRDGLHVVRNLIDDAELAALAQRVRFQLERAMRPGATEGERGARLLLDARRELAALGEALFAPLADHLRGASRLMLVPAGALHSLPLHAMIYDHRYLLESFDIGYAPSAAVWLQLAARPGQTSRAATRGLVVGVADENAPQIANEIRAVAAATGFATTLSAEQATVQAVSMALAQADIAHVACHGAFAPGDPFGSGLKLHDRWMNLHDVLDLRLHARLITLSGCHTGLSSVAVGDELFGLLRGFLAAGARSLLATLWAVHDETTTRLMTTFYQQAAYNNWNAARALRAAQRAVMEHHPHPYFWAPFFLLGDV
ncbi:MAG: CHAT domain-containing protein [Phycisphaerales bacterium]|nr:CHAT domain-containing protein [Phycisphaerales bacterium]